MKRKKPLRIIETKLGRQDAFGQYWEGSRLIELDPRLPSKIYLQAMVHESIHDIEPNMSEAKVKRLARRLTNILWKHNVRILRK